MRRVFYLLAVVSALLTVYGAYHLSQQYAHTDFVQLGSVKGFSDDSQGTEFQTLAAQFKQKIQLHRVQAEKDQNTYFWITFLVTALTAGSTLVSSIFAAKKEGPDAGVKGKAPVVVIAILTFLSTLANFAGTHYNERKTEQTKRVTDLEAKRESFFKDYMLAPASGKAAVILNYGKEVDN